jgi:hypothetical protein
MVFIAYPQSIPANHKASHCRCSLVARKANRSSRTPFNARLLAGRRSGVHCRAPSVEYIEPLNSLRRITARLETQSSGALDTPINSFRHIVCLFLSYCQ